MSVADNNVKDLLFILLFIVHEENDGGDVLSLRRQNQLQKQYNLMFGKMFSLVIAYLYCFSCVLGKDFIGNRTRKEPRGLSCCFYRVGSP